MCRWEHEIRKSRRKNGLCNSGELRGAMRIANRLTASGNLHDTHANVSRWRLSKLYARPQVRDVLGKAHELRIHILEVAGATVDLRLARHEHGVAVNVLRREGDVEVLVVT